MKRPLDFGESKGDVYLVQSSNHQPLKSSDLFSNNSSTRLALVSSSSSVSFPTAFSIPILKFSYVKLWHLRLGHMPYSAMKIIFSNSFSLAISDNECPCDVCPTTRQSKLPFPCSNIKTKRIFELIHIDTYGPYKTPTYNEYKYFITIVDDFSRATWTCFLSAKSNAFTILKYFLAMESRQIQYES